MNNDIFLSNDDEFEAVIYELLEADIDGTQSLFLTDDLNSNFENQPSGLQTSHF